VGHACHIKQIAVRPAALLIKKWEWWDGRREYGKGMRWGEGWGEGRLEMG